MLSATSHLLFWALALASLPLSLLRERFRASLPCYLADALLEHVVYGFGAAVVLSGRHGGCARGVYFLCLAALCVAAYEVVTKIGFVGGATMPESLGGEGVDGMRMVVAHVLGAFMVLGTLEPLRRDRRDMEACGLGFICMHPLRKHKTQSPMRLTLVGLAGLASVVACFSLALRASLGRSVDLVGFWFPEGLSLRETFVHGWMLSPLLDVAETALYAVGGVVAPKWTEGRARVIRRQG